MHFLLPWTSCILWTFRPSWFKHPINIMWTVQIVSTAHNLFPLLTPSHPLISEYSAQHFQVLYACALTHFCVYFCSEHLWCFLLSVRNFSTTFWHFKLTTCGINYNAIIQLIFHIILLFVVK
jgi:hypothetical protein